MRSAIGKRKKLRRTMRGERRACFETGSSVRSIGQQYTKNGTGARAEGATTAQHQQQPCRVNTTPPPPSFVASLAPKEGLAASSLSRRG